MFISTISILSASASLFWLLLDTHPSYPTSLNL
nr:MAG TPA: hypothetical protein [Caudoviricetes sp.]DAJ95610.1 MAG TPA: hypothetical protein [Caudoviricetes sp.]DAV59852.1 MAG TPA: hypothetical protein [Caudoviricetes sp.]